MRIQQFMKLSKDLQFYVDKLKNGEKFSLARYGDGELYCMWGRQGGNSNGCRYSPELREALLDSMKHKDDPTFIYGLQRVLPRDEERVMLEYPDHTWYDTEIFSEAVANGELYPLIEQLRKMKVVVIGNTSIKDAVELIFEPIEFIEVPPSNAFDHPISFKKHEGDIVYLYSCGMAANAFIADAHGKIDGWLIDVGHIWDPFAGLMSRCDLEGKTKEDIEKNLCPLDQ